MSKRSPTLMALLVAALGAGAVACVEAGPGAPANHPSPAHGGAPAPAPVTKAGEPLPASALSGPYPTLAKACEAAAGPAGAQPGAPCGSTPIALGAGAPFSAALLRAEDKRDPRYAASGVFFLAVGKDGEWFVSKKPIDQINGAAGKTFLPVVSVAEVAAAAGAVMIHLRDTSTSVCNLCEPPERDKHAPAGTRGIVMACGKNPHGAPACTAAMDVDEKAKATLGTDGTLTIATPGGAPKIYRPAF